MGFVPVRIAAEATKCDWGQYDWNSRLASVITQWIDGNRHHTIKHHLLLSCFHTFQCPICLDMLKKTMTTKECLHRFCSDCIITALRSGNKECPTCRKKLVSKRSLRADPNFDLLISNIYPSREEYEAIQVSGVSMLSITCFYVPVHEIWYAFVDSIMSVFTYR